MFSYIKLPNSLETSFPSILLAGGGTPHGPVPDKNAFLLLITLAFYLMPPPAPPAFNIVVDVVFLRAALLFNDDLASI
jgi:hypothetical protein